MTGAIGLQVEGAVAWLVLNRPAKRNALSAAMWRAIPELAAEASKKAEIRALILRGATAEAFSAGADIGEFEEVHATPAAARAYHDLVLRAYDAIARLEVPTIAMVRGLCYGGGCALALACDLRYADPSARFCIPPARLGLAYSIEETKRLVDLVGPAKAKEMLMGARVLAAEEALASGLVTRLFADGALERETIAFAEHLSTLSRFSIRATKVTVAEILNGAVEDTATTRTLFEEQFRSPDYLEGRRAFMAKRQPRFGGR